MKKAARTNKKNIQKIKSSENITIINIKIFFICITTYLLLFWLFPIYSFIMLYLIIGLVIISINGRSSANIYIGGLVGFLGSLIASLFLTVDKYIYYVNTMPVNVNPDIPMSLYTNNLFNLVKLTPLSYINKPLFILISTLLCAAFTQFGLLKNIKNIAAYIVISILAVNFLFISLFSSRDLARYASVEPPNLSYAYDAIVYMKTVYLMSNKGYYKAHLEAQFNDSRRNKDGTMENGKFVGKGSPLWLRQPFIFYFWKYISFGNLSRVLYFSILFCTLLLFLSYYAAKRIVNSYSIIASIFITPFLFTGTTWINIFFPDWWVGLFLLSALLFWILKKFWAAAILLLFAMLSREVTTASYVLFLLLAFIKYKSALKPFLIIGIIFLAMYSLHYVNASQIFVDGKVGSSIESIEKVISFRLIPNISYMMFLYGFFKIPVILLSILALVFSIVTKSLEFTVFVIYSLIHNSIGPSSYWGNHFMLIILFSLILILKFEPKIKIKVT